MTKVYAVLLGIVCLVFVIAGTTTYMVMSLRQAERDRQTLLRTNRDIEVFLQCFQDTTDRPTLSVCLSEKRS